MYPIHRIRRMRQSEGRRHMIRETTIDGAGLVYPIVVVPGMNKEGEDDGGWLPVYSVDRLHVLVTEMKKLGLGSLYLYGVPENRDDTGSEAYSGAGTVQRALRAVKHAHPDMIVITDIGLSPYTKHGYPGVMEAGVMHNEATVEVVQRIALSHAGCGADFVAPTNMMDGQVIGIRQALEEHGFDETGIMAGSCMYDSAFGHSIDRATDDVDGKESGGQHAEGDDSPKTSPLHVLVGSEDRSDRPSLDRVHGEVFMDPANSNEALREAALDIEEGADVLMISPALFNLDVLRKVKENFQMPVAALSGEVETMMLKCAAKQGIIDERQAILEMLLIQRRAGADMFITPFAKRAAAWLGR